MSKKLPEIRINFSRLLFEDVSKKIAKLNGWDLKSVEQYREWAEAYRKAWLERETEILSAMMEITDLEFYLPVIDITAAPGLIPKSEPLTIGFREKPDKTVYTITHELTHTLLCDNTVVSVYGTHRGFHLSDAWEKLYGFQDDTAALVHVPVLAVCKKIFEDYLNDHDYVTYDREMLTRYNSESYLKAWDYIDKVGADTIIDKLKKSYAEIAKELEVAA